MKQRVARAFAQRVQQGNLGTEVQIVYRVAGGMPSQRVEYEIALDSASGARIAALDARLTRTTRRLSIPPEALDIPGLFADVSNGLQSLHPESRHTFPPDALVGSMTIRVDGDEETFFFVPEAEKRRKPGREVVPSMDRALQRLWSLARRATEEQRGASYE